MNIADEQQNMKWGVVAVLVKSEELYNPYHEPNLAMNN